MDAGGAGTSGRTASQISTWRHWIETVAEDCWWAWQQNSTAGARIISATVMINQCMLRNALILMYPFLNYWILPTVCYAKKNCDLKVQSRVQKYFIRLAKEGMPIPGRIPSNLHGTGGRKRRTYQGRYTTSTFCASYKWVIVQNLVIARTFARTSDLHVITPLSSYSGHIWPLKWHSYERIMWKHY